MILYKKTYFLQSLHFWYFLCFLFSHFGTFIKSRCILNLLVFSFHFRYFKLKKYQNLKNVSYYFLNFDTFLIFIISFDFFVLFILIFTIFYLLFCILFVPFTVFNLLLYIFMFIFVFILFIYYLLVLFYYNFVLWTIFSSFTLKEAQIRNSFLLGYKKV